MSFSVYRTIKKDVMKNIIILFVFFYAFNTGETQYSGKETLSKMGVDSIKIDITAKEYEKAAKILQLNANATLKIYYKDSVLIKFNAFYEGVREDLISNYYFKKDTIEIIKTLKVYNLPKWKNKSKIERIIVNNYILYNDSIVSCEFSNGEILRNVEGGIDLKLKQKEIINDVKLYRQYYDSIR